MVNSRETCMVAVLAAMIVLAWQAATVHFNYGGNWSGLFYIGNRWEQPPGLSKEQNLVFSNLGYDGGFYHLMAHDPWMTRGFSKYIDNPNLRYRRILIPVLTHIAALGSDQRVHACYIGIHLLFVFAGAFWLAGYCALSSLSPVWGFGFLAIPSVLVSIDRLTIDTALAALVIGFIFYVGKGNRASSLALLALAPLARETGLFLTGGQAWECTSKHEWKKLVLALASSIPFLSWSLFIFSKSTHDGTHWFSFPLAGILQRTIHPLRYAITGRWVAAAASMDYLALIGVWIAIGSVVWFALKRRSGLAERCAFIFTFGAVWLGKADIWDGAYEFGRTMSPLFIMLGLLAIRDRNRWLLLPLVCVLPRILLQFEPQILGILRQIV